MLRRTRCSLSISVSALKSNLTQKYKPTKVKWTNPYQGYLVPEDFTSEDIDDAEEYVQEWHFPYPGQKECSFIDPSARVMAIMPLAPGDRFHKQRATYSRQGSLLAQAIEPGVLARLKN